MYRIVVDCNIEIQIIQLLFSRQLQQLMTNSCKLREVEVFRSFIIIFIQRRIVIVIIQQQIIIKSPQTKWGCIRAEITDSFLIDYVKLVSSRSVDSSFESIRLNNANGVFGDFLIVQFIVFVSFLLLFFNYIIFWIK